MQLSPDTASERFDDMGAAWMPQGRRIRPPVPTAEQSRAAPERPECTPVGACATSSCRGAPGAGGPRAVGECQGRMALDERRR